MGGGRWYKPEDDAWLREHYARATHQELLDRFPGRGIPGIRQRASCLGLRKDKDAFNYGSPVTTVIGHLSDCEKAYLAGIIDGEGCIMLQRRTPKNKRHPTYALYLSIANTSPALRQWLDVRFPNRVYYTRLGSRNVRRQREGYNWILAGNRQVLVFLREIAPHLVIKREQAELLSAGYLLLPEAERFALFQKLREMKKTA